MKTTLRGDKRKNPEMIELRELTTNDVLNGNRDGFGYLRLGQLFTLDKNGKAAHVRQSGKIKTWKRDPGRFEFPVKYGLYESWHITDKTINELLVIV
jgi:hypothetical protein